MEKRHPLVQKMIDICNEEQNSKIKKLVALEDQITNNMDKNYEKMADTVRKLSSFMPSDRILFLLKKCGLTDEDIKIVLEKLEK